MLICGILIWKDKIIMPTHFLYLKIDSLIVHTKGNKNLGSMVLLSLSSQGFDIFLGLMSERCLTIFS